MKILLTEEQIIHIEFFIKLLRHSLNESNGKTSDYLQLIRNIFWQENQLLAAYRRYENAVNQFASVCNNKEKGKDEDEKSKIDIIIKWVNVQRRAFRIKNTLESTVTECYSDEINSIDSYFNDISAELGVDLPIRNPHSYKGGHVKPNQRGIFFEKSHPSSCQREVEYMDIDQIIDSCRRSQRKQ